MKRTTFADKLELAEIYTVYTSPSTNAAIVDAKEKYAEKNNVDKDRLTARKFGSGWDKERDSPYMRIAVSLSYGEVQ